MKTRAAVLNASPVERPYAETRPLSIEEIVLDPPGPGEVLVKVKAASLCHSDLSVINGDRPRPMPMVLGHEAAGIVEETGPGVDDLEPGDHVVMVFVPSCGHCLPCAEGRPALCEPGNAANGAGTLISGARRLHRSGGDVNHHIGVSAFADHAVLSRRSLIRIGREFPLDKAALFGCAVLTGVGAVINTADVKAGQSVAVVGLGGVGLSALLGAVAAGASRIVAVDLAEDKLAFASELGATDTVNASEPGCADEVREITGGGVDHAFEMAGSVKAFELAYKITRRGGSTVTAGLANPAHTIALPPVSLVAEERTVRGSYVGSAIPMRDLPRYMALYAQGRLPVDRLMTSTGTLDGINEAFDMLADGRTVRHVMTL
ncbi:alcohol dehydrogenase catalytic domain-containing protein [Kaustia mangrovi]|uniref:Alcohol dehydrogenase catalytic domain-containing protein n=1 Tax=Kaustia mangrovi TaxID=2593653 RepID=A0A7S8C5R2_9HYPH|nr:zinc-dependent alcohol dehydrogenase family protein [Kaustia mangrovi]QPC43900.1 alcohol dehydrogenase catalytic domain-containing protein [Kaustia mangrovi]